jgi:hypothetical protein
MGKPIPREITSLWREVQYLSGGRHTNLSKFSGASLSSRALAISCSALCAYFLKWHCNKGRAVFHAAMQISCTRTLSVPFTWSRNQVIVPAMQKKVEEKEIVPAMQKKRKMLRSCCDSNYLKSQRATEVRCTDRPGSVGESSQAASMPLLCAPPCDPEPHGPTAGIGTNCSHFLFRVDGSSRR